MTTQNEEKIREAFEAWCERTRQARAYHSGVIVVEPTDDNYCVWQAATTQGEQERKQLQLAHGLVKAEYHSAMNTNSELERKLSEQRAESQKREVELLGKYETTLTMIKDLSEQLSKYKEAKPVAYVKYRIGDFPEFLPIIAGKVRTTENLSEYVPLYDNVL